MEDYHSHPAGVLVTDYVKVGSNEVGAAANTRTISQNPAYGCAHIAQAGVDTIRNPAYNCVRNFPMAEAKGSESIKIDQMGGEIVVTQFEQHHSADSRGYEHVSIDGKGSQVKVAQFEQHSDI